MKKFNISWLLGIILFLGCKKDSAEVIVSLTSKIWTPALTDKNTSTNPSGQIAYHATLDCEKDDSYRFGTDGKLTINKGANKCNSTEVSTEVVDYTYNVNTKELLIKGVNYSVVDESSVQLKYYTVLPNTTGFQYLIFLFN